MDVVSSTILLGSIRLTDTGTLSSVFEKGFHNSFFLLPTRASSLQVLWVRHWGSLLGRLKHLYMCVVLTDNEACWISHHHNFWLCIYDDKTMIRYTLFASHIRNQSELLELEICGMSDSQGISIGITFCFSTRHIVVLWYGSRSSSTCYW